MKSKLLSDCFCQRKRWFDWISYEALFHRACQGVLIPFSCRRHSWRSRGSKRALAFTALICSPKVLSAQTCYWRQFWLATSTLLHPPLSQSLPSLSQLPVSHSCTGAQPLGFLPWLSAGTWSKSLALPWSTVALLVPRKFCKHICLFARHFKTPSSLWGGCLD